MENKEEIKRIDGKYYLVRELEMEGDPVRIDGEKLQPIESIDDDDCQHCCLYDKSNCGEVCVGGFFVRVLPENSEEKDEEKLSNVEETGKNLETEKEETTMERKIGEIFEYNGEWYQCVEGEWCCRCDFHRPNFDITQCNHYPHCMASARSDHKHVIFKKLEKFRGYGNNGKIYQLYRLPMRVEQPLPHPEEVTFITPDIVQIEIKQTKEDMGDNRIINQHFAECVQTINDVVRECYTENKSTQIKDMEEYKMYDAKEDIPEFDKVVDECLFGKKELKLKPFDLEAAKAGKPVCTRDGRKVRIICFDKEDIRPIVALIKSDKGGESAYYYHANGMTLSDNYQSVHDLMMLPEKKEGWVNVYEGGLLDVKSYKTKEEALAIACHKNYVDTVKIEWEE